MAAPKKSSLNNALNDLKKLGSLKLLHIKKSTFDGFNLSEKQEKIIRLAIDLGYYEWPKKISAQEIAKRLKLSPATVLEHLRKAEFKIIKKNLLL